ncbi:MAG: VWA-like domain-containing protein [Clostridium sp.]|nr:VWA-like domain-containing protein [Clostridium sp.]
MGTIHLSARISALAAEILRLSRDQILLHLRFLDVALSALVPQEKAGMGGCSCDGKHLYYDAQAIVRAYRREQASVMRMLLHVLFHLLFFHGFGYERVEKEIWDISVDMAVEHAVMELGLPGAELRSDLRKKEAFSYFEQQGVKLTAEKLYRYLQKNPPAADEQAELARLFCVDMHEGWGSREEAVISLAEWKRIAERAKAELKAFSQGKNMHAVEENLTEATRDRVDYRAFLQRFVVSGEVVKNNDEEFDYIAYTYGLSQYGNVPIVEPLEYREVDRIRDFVIAIDTSASCRGETVRTFLRHTYSIMKTSACFFDDMLVHIIQCDHEVRSDTVIHDQNELDAFLTGGKLVGFGSTDFRPVFTYVDELIARGEIGNVKGLIYFTDGQGVYPEKAPDYETVFAFLNEAEFLDFAPAWAVRICLDEDVLIERERDA